MVTLTHFVHCSGPCVIFCLLVAMISLSNPKRVICASGMQSFRWWCLDEFLDGEVGLYGEPEHRGSVLLLSLPNALAYNLVAGSPYPQGGPLGEVSTKECPPNCFTGCSQETGILT